MAVLLFQQCSPCGIYFIEVHDGVSHTINHIWFKLFQQGQLLMILMSKWINQHVFSYAIGYHLTGEKPSESRSTDIFTSTLWLRKNSSFLLTFNSNWEVSYTLPLDLNWNKRSLFLLYWSQTGPKVTIFMKLYLEVLLKYWNIEYLNLSATIII